MHVTSVNVDSTGACGRKHLITVCVKLSGLKEMMTINVFVPHNVTIKPLRNGIWSHKSKRFSRASSLAFLDHENIVSKLMGVLQP